MAAIPNRGKQESKDLMVVGDHLQQDTFMSNQRMNQGSLGIL